MIPKKIHYCWVGGAPKPESVLVCINSWKKYCPDYEIIEWNETNYDFTKNKYMQQAYENKKWGFVPDYARLDIIYEHGGIYLDTDVELIKSFDDMLQYPAFMGFEETGTGEYFVNCGHGFGAEPHHEIIKSARDLYDKLSFIKEDGTLNMLASPFYTTQSLKKFGLVQKNKQQELPNMIVFPSEVLCPKNFMTGKVNITKKSVSIHHFTASWLDDQIKNDLKKQQKFNNLFGKKLGAKMLYLDSVREKYLHFTMIGAAGKKVISKTKGKIISVYEDYNRFHQLSKAQSFNPKETNNVVLMDPSKNGDNIGDEIIMTNCMKQLPDSIKEKSLSHVSTHTLPDEEEIELLKNAEYKIFCGTNAMSGTMESYHLWVRNSDVSMYRNMVSMGVGFGSNSKTNSRYTKKFCKTILSNKYIHSVRDSFSAEMLKSMGINNVLYTGCPTMWGITKELCSSIPTKKADNVICTLTDYDRDYDNDQFLLDKLSEMYENVYLWPQGVEDDQYFDDLILPKNVTRLKFGLEYYNKILELKNLDYVGTRLHAGIRSIQCCHRTLIISIDNRAECIAKDTNLPIIYRNDIRNNLEKMICNDLVTDIKMPIENINKWKNQFK